MSGTEAATGRPEGAGPDPAFLRRKRRAKALDWGLGLGVFVVLLAAWEVSARLKLVNPLFFSSPSRVAADAVDLWRSGDLPRHLLASGEVFGLGFVLSAALGVPLGLLLGWFSWASRAFTPLVSALNTTPRIALMPLFIIWFGLGFGSKLVMVFAISVFPIIVNMQVAMQNIDREFTQVGRAYGASRWQLFKTVALPSSVPFLLTGLRLAAGRALLGVITAEIFGGSEGLGFLIQYAGQTFQTDTVFVCVAIIASVGILLDRALLGVQHRVDAWRGNDT